MTLQNFDLYFPIQIWRSKSGMVRLEPPQITMKKDGSYEFLTHFWDAIEGIDKSTMEMNWSYDTTFWAFNPGYSYLLGRGYLTLVVSQNTSFPFESIRIRSFITSVSVFNLYSENSFGFVAYAYPFPKTSLLVVMKTDITLNLITKIILCDEKETGCRSTDPLNNFLPSLTNKKKPFYDILISDIALELYVYRQKPQGLFFRPNTEGICLPSADPEDYSSITDCIRDSYKDKVLFFRSYTQTNNKDLQQVMFAYPPPPENILFGEYWVPAMFLLLLSIILLFLLLQSQSR